MKNIEIKVKLDNPKNVLGKIKKIGAKFKTTLNQVDTYYFCKKGLLKIREINKKQFELIYYQRPKTYNSKISQYLLIDINKDQVRILKKVLSIVLGEKIIVKKIRKLWVLRNTRIHVDKVVSLGEFLELETVINSRKNNAQKEHSEIKRLLSLREYKKIDKSYFDLVSIRN